MSRPCIKGAIFAGAVEDVNKLVASGRVQERELDRWLQPGDRALLGEKILVSSWYDIHAFRRMTELLRDVAGGGSHEYLRELGRESARRLIRSGLYAQMEYLQRTEVRRSQDAHARFEALGRDLRRITTLGGSVFNFLKWTVVPDPEHADRYQIHVGEARDYPDVVVWRTEGFVNEMTAQAGAPDLFRWERPEPDRVVFRMTRSI